MLPGEGVLVGVDGVPVRRGRPPKAIQSQLAAEGREGQERVEPGRRDVRPAPRDVGDPVRDVPVHLRDREGRVAPDRVHLLPRLTACFEHQHAKRAAGPTVPAVDRPVALGSAALLDGLPHERDLAQLVGEAVAEQHVGLPTEVVEVVLRWQTVNAYHCVMLIDVVPVALLQQYRRRPDERAAAKRGKGHGRPVRLQDPADVNEGHVPRLHGRLAFPSLFSGGCCPTSQRRSAKRPPRR
mmetsp:Transcript_111988/g.317074  ORF Transcript_111988/g.317074 Transcript_111988/m.317074 type:complete len:239 (+) Transcript_111988:238-954(+)